MLDIEAGHTIWIWQNDSIRPVARVYDETVSRTVFRDRLQVTQSKFLENSGARGVYPLAGKSLQRPRVGFQKQNR